MMQTRLIALALLIAGSGIGWWVSTTAPFHLGLDLAGGTQLLYQAQTEELEPTEVRSAMESLRLRIERRVNTFGVSEPLVQTQGENRLIIELPGITDTQQAIASIGKLPVLDFRLFVPTEDGGEYVATGISGKHITTAVAEMGGVTIPEWVVNLTLDSEGGDEFAKITKENVGEILGIFIDGQPISEPVIRDEILGGQVQISGNFTPQEARELANNLKDGALPVAIKLLSAQTIGASLGAEAVERGVMAGLYGLAFVALFLILWYRVPGLIATLALSIYIAVMLAIFKFVPVTLTAAGIAGFIVSIGMAVDANVLIFARMKEELAEKGSWTHNAIKNGFSRAWLSIRDGNLSSIITAIILFWFGTSLVKGFALVFGLGVLVSMLTAITVTRTLLLAIGDYEHTGWIKKLLGSGIK